MRREERARYEGESERQLRKSQDEPGVQITESLGSFIMDFETLFSKKNRMPLKDFKQGRMRYPVEGVTLAAIWRVNWRGQG